MGSFLSDCRPATSSAESEAFVISLSYGWGTPWPRAKARGTASKAGTVTRPTAASAKLVIENSAKFVFTVSLSS